MVAIADVREMKNFIDGIFFYALGSALAMPSISLRVLDLFPTRRGMAASLMGFVSGIINTIVAGVISPAVSHSPKWLAVAMVAILACGLLCWLGYLRLSRTSSSPRDKVLKA